MVNHPFIFFCLSEVKSQGQKQGRPDLPLASHRLRLIRGNFDTFPGWLNEIITPVVWGFLPVGHTQLEQVIQEVSVSASSFQYGETVFYFEPNQSD